MHERSQGLPKQRNDIDCNCRSQSNKESLHGFFNILDSATIAGIKYACTDMWPAYFKLLKERASWAWNILDRFHIAKKFGEALDKVRAEETRQLSKDGCEAVLKNFRWSILKRRSNLPAKQTVKPRELLQYNLQTMKAYLMREDFNRFWAYTSPGWASKFLREWCTRASRSRIEPMQKIAKMVRQHEQLLLNWFKSQVIFGCCGGGQQQSEIDHEKSLWVQGLRNHHNRNISSTWQPS